MMCPTPNSTLAKTGFAAWPDELVLRVIQEMEPHDVLLAVTPVCRRFARISKDQGLWRTICARSLLAHAPNGATVFDHDLWLGGLLVDGVALLDFWKDFLRIWLPRCGWWAAMEGLHGGVYRIAPDFDRGVISLRQLIPDNVINSAREGHAIPPSTLYHQGALIVRAAWGYVRLGVELLHPSTDMHELDFAKYVPLDAEYDGKPLPGVSLSVRGSPVKDITCRPWADLLEESSVAPFPPPSLTPALRIVPGTTLHSDSRIPALSFPPHRLVPLLSPEEFVDNDPVKAGWYCGTYGPHGTELIFIHTVDAAAPCNPDIDWPWDELSAPTRGRRIEGIKLTGDPNVPRGQRTFVAFLSGPDVRAYAVPETSCRSFYKPWPFVEDDPNLPASVLPHFYSSTSGITAPGVGRIAQVGFVDLDWMACIVHVASRVEIQVFWPEWGKVSMFRRLGTPV